MNKNIVGKAGSYTKEYVNLYFGSSGSIFVNHSKFCLSINMQGTRTIIHGLYDAVTILHLKVHGNYQIIQGGTFIGSIIQRGTIIGTIIQGGTFIGIIIQGGTLINNVVQWGTYVGIIIQGG